jgi:hypothetical protein
MYYVRNFSYFGRIKIMIQHVRLLQRAGIEAKLFVLRPPDIKVYDVDENLLTSDSMVLKMM